MTNYREQYNKKVSRFFWWCLIVHLPIQLAVGYYFKMSLVQASVLYTLILLGPALAYFTRPSSVMTLNVMSFAMMAQSALIIHLSRGMIEFHFHIFTFLASFIIMGYLSPLITALGFVAIHHIGFWFFLPQSVFNYQASFWIVLVHAVFAIVETVICLYIAKKFGSIIEMQGSTMADLSTIVEESLRSGSDLKEAANSLAHATQIEASAVQETASTLQQITSMSQMNFDSTKKSFDVAVSSYDLATKGESEATSLMESIKAVKEDYLQIEQITSENQKEMAEIIKTINNISQKTQAIYDIVFQVKILSFNASVEAARAGEHGKGFAVVAEEVGKLAQHSAHAAEEIESIVAESIQKVQGTLGNTQKKIRQTILHSHETVENGVTKTNDFVSLFGLLHQNIRTVRDEMEAIVGSMKEQTSGMQSISEAIKNISETTNTNAALSQKLTVSSERVAKDSNSLKTIVQELSIDHQKNNVA